MSRILASHENHGRIRNARDEFGTQETFQPGNKRLHRLSAGQEFATAVLLGWRKPQWRYWLICVRKRGRNPWQRRLLRESNLHSKCNYKISFGFYPRNDSFWLNPWFHLWFYQPCSGWPWSDTKKEILLSTRLMPPPEPRHAALLQQTFKGV